MANLEQTDPKSAPAASSSEDETLREREVLVKENEAAIKEREQRVREDDLAFRRQEAERAVWSRPLNVAIIAAAIAALGNAMVAWLNGNENRTLEESKAESARILEMIKTGDADRAAVNLQFLADAGLVADRSRYAAIRKYLAQRTPGVGPALPSPADTLRPAKELADVDTLRKAFGAIGRLHTINKEGDESTCTAFRVSYKYIVTPRYCVYPNGKQALKVAFAAVGQSGEAEKTPLETKVPPIENIKVSDDDQNTISVLELVDPSKLPRVWLRLGKPEIAEKMQLSTLAFLGNSELQFLRSKDCVVIEVKDKVFSHTCHLKAGAGGAPILNEDGSTVVGIETWGDGKIEWSARADQLAASSSILQSTAASPQ